MELNPSQLVSTIAVYYRAGQSAAKIVVGLRSGRSGRKDNTLQEERISFFKKLKCP